MQYVMKKSKIEIPDSAEESISNIEAEIVKINDLLKEILDRPEEYDYDQAAIAQVIKTRKVFKVSIENLRNL